MQNPPKEKACTTCKYGWMAFNPNYHNSPWYCKHPDSTTLEISPLGEHNYKYQSCIDFRKSECQGVLWEEIIHKQKPLISIILNKIKDIWLLYWPVIVFPTLFLSMPISYLIKYYL